MLKNILWILIFIFIIEFFFNSIFEPPANNRQPSRLANYFEYGRSTEAKIINLVSTNDITAANIAKAGWYKDKDIALQNRKKNELQSNIFIYGMSFSNHIGKVLSIIDSSLNIIQFAGPSAPLNHSYEYYDLHRPHEEGDIIIL